MATEGHAMLPLAKSGAVMVGPVDLAHLVTRVRQARELALESGDVAVRLAHQEMADQYAKQILAARASQ
jgi:hypothetical protein